MWWKNVRDISQSPNYSYKHNQSISATSFWTTETVTNNTTTTGRDVEATGVEPNQTFNLAINYRPHSGHREDSIQVVAYSQRRGGFVGGGCTVTIHLLTPAINVT